MVRHSPVVQALAVAFLFALPASAAVKTQDLKYTVDQTEYIGYLAYDDGNAARRPGILIAPEWVGLNDYSRGRAKQLAEMGYVAFVFDPYGGGKNAADVKQSAEWSGALKADRPELRKRINGALETFRKQDRVDPTKIAAIGYCFGGTTVLELARSGADVQGVVSFHGGLSTTMPAKAGEMKAKVLVCHGAVDPFVPPAEVAAFEKEMQDAKADWQLISYGNAVHSFTNPAAKGQIPGAQYDEKADKRSWEAMKGFFAELFLPAIDAALPLGPDGPVFGNGRRARSVVFVYDHSGWTINMADGMKKVLAQAVADLKVEHQFNVIYFTDGKAVVFSPGKNVAATDVNKKAALQFIADGTPTGAKDPKIALEQAAKLNSDLVYLLVALTPAPRGDDFPDRLLNLFDSLKFAPTTRMHTVSYGPHEREARLENVLREIAYRHNGSYRYVYAAD